MRHLVLFSVLLLGTVWAAAQNYPSQGSSGNAAGQQSVKGCLSSAAGTYSITDKSGTWSIYNLPAGNYKAQMIGAEKSKTDPVDFTVKSASFWEKISGTSQKDVVWTPEIKVDNTISTISPAQ